MIDRDALTLDEKCRLLGGASTWRTHAIDHAGVPAVKMTDGPNGARGDGIGATGTPGVVAPVGIALGATWDPDVVGQVAEVLGREARRKSAHVLLAPTVNLQRTPIGGRVFECYSEDPELTARLAVAYVRGVQSQGVGVAIKHFVANDTELDRFTVDACVDERTLRELYLRPFEAAVAHARPWGLMSGYNQLNGTHCSQHRWLLHDVLRGEWGFDGFVVSDWFGFHDTAASVRAGLTVAMPGPNTCYGEPLLRAVEAGDVPEADVDALVDDLLRLIERTDATGRSSEGDEVAVDDRDERALMRGAVAAGIVLLRNEDGALPLAPGTRVAVLGQNAAETRIMGGGSASLEPLPHTSILEAMQAREELTVEYEVGVRIEKMAPPPSAAQLRTPEGDAGVLVTYRNGQDPDAPVVVQEVAPSTSLRWFGSTPPGVDPGSFNVTVEGTYTPTRSGVHTVSAVTTGPSKVTLGGVTPLDDPDGSGPRGDFFFGLGSEECLASVDLEAGEPVAIRAWIAGTGGFGGLRVGVAEPDDPGRMDRALALAAKSDVALVVVGTNEEWETEGTDRTSIELPGAQNELIQRVAEVAPRTVVLVNAGSPIAMPWRDEVDAIALTYFGGHAMGEAVADILLGDTDPGGRLPITYPAALEHVPAWPYYRPIDGVQTYGEGLAMGYRGLLSEGPRPLYPFGHGLSYGETSWGQPRLIDGEVTVGDDVRLVVPVTSTGDRPATVVVQAYVGLPDGVDDGGAPWKLGGWTKRAVRPGGAQDIEVVIPSESLRRWDEERGWVIDPGQRAVRIAASAIDVHAELVVGISAP